jgi:hypothetical protein
VLNFKRIFLNLKQVFGILVFLLLFLVFPATVSAETYYVDATGGSDSDAGTSTDQAWQTITKVNSVSFLSGDSILFKRGETWTGTQLTGQSGVTYADYGSGNKPIIDGNNAINYAFYAESTDGITLQNLDLRNGLSSSTSFKTSTNIEVIDADMSGAGNDNLLIWNNSSNVTISGGKYYNAVAGGGHSGIEIADGGSGFTIDGVESYNNPIGITVHNHPATDFPDNVTIKNCSVYSNTTNGIQLGEDGAAGSKTITIQDCSVYDNTTNGVAVTSISGNYLEGNITIKDVVAYGNVQRNFDITGDDVTLFRITSHKGGVSTNKGIRILNSLRTTIYNITSYHSAYTGFDTLLIDGARTDDTTLKNNILAGGDTGVYPITITAATDPTNKTWDIDYNLYVLPQPTFLRWKWNDIAYSFTNWKTQSGQDSHSQTTTDALFTDLGANDYTLQPASLAINTGIDVGLTYSGSAPDLGAYEFVSPSTPSSLVQYDSDGSTSMAVGEGTDNTSVVLKFTMSSSNSSDSLTPQVEVREVGIAFSNSVTHSGDAVAFSGSGVTGSVTVSGLSLGKTYHWQARSSNSVGQSSWVSFGSNSEVSSDFRTDISNPTSPSLLSPTGYTKDNTRPTLIFKKATDVISEVSSYTATLDSGKNKSYFISGVPATGNGLISYTWKDDNNVRVEFFNENDSDSANDEIRVYFKGLDNNELAEGKHTWTIKAHDLVSNSTSQSADILLDRTSPFISELAIADVSIAISGVFYNLSTTNRTPSFSGLATDIYQGSTVTNNNGTKDTFDKVSSGPKTITLTIKRLDGEEYKDYLSKDYPLSDITDFANDKKTARFYATTPFPLVDGKYKVQLTIKDDAGNTHKQPDFYLSLNSDQTNIIQTLLTGHNLETDVVKQEITPAGKENEQEIQEESYEVKIKVVDKENSPVKGAKVTIHSKVQTATTDENGVARFFNVESGDHRVLIAYDNYEGEQKISLTGGVKEFSLTIQVQEASLFSTNLERFVIVILGIIILGLIVSVYRARKSKKVKSVF